MSSAHPQSSFTKPAYKLLSVQGVAGFLDEVNKIASQGYRIKFIRFERPQEASELAFSRTLITTVFEAHPKAFTYTAAMLDYANDIDDWLSSEAHEGARLVTVCGFLVRRKDAIYEGPIQKEVEVVSWTNLLLTEREAVPRGVSTDRSSLDEGRQANLRYVGMVGARMDAVVLSNETALNRQTSKTEYKLISFIESKDNPPVFAVSRLREMQILLDSAIVDGYELRDLVVAENTKILVMVKTK